MVGLHGHLRSSDVELEAGGTVMVEPSPDGSEGEEMKLSIVKPDSKPTPVGVGGRKEGEEPEAVDDHGALDQPAVPPPTVDE